MGAWALVVCFRNCSIVHISGNMKMNKVHPLHLIQIQIQFQFQVQVLSFLPPMMTLPAVIRMLR